jgi:CpeT/CpcT family protein DUF1001
MRNSTLWFATALSLLAMAGVAEARNEKKKEEAEFVALLKMLPGEYDNLSQIDSEGDSPQHLSVLLSIKPLESDTVGKLVMFVRETAADDTHRVLAQRIWTMEKTKEHQIIQRVYLFKEPQRWIHAADDPLVLRSLLPDDLSQLSGCELLWTKTETGYAAAVRPQACRPGGSSEGLLIETSAELSADDLTLNEQQAGRGGRLPAESNPASLYRFQRRGG